MATHSKLAQFISSLLPAKANDVPLHYHVPWNGYYDFDTALVEQVILSVTPTPNVYELIDACKSDNNGLAEEQPTSSSDDEEPRSPNTIAFFHRPFTLDRRRIRNNLLVLASHTSFDENLTVGWNPTLAQRLGVDISGNNSICIQGYKGDADRRIGTIAKASMILGPLLESIEEEFGSIEHAQEGLSEEIHVFAMMNPFSADTVDRVLDMALERNWVPSDEHLGRHVLYLTGQPRKSGLQAAKRHGMTVVCVGRRVAEQWGISYMASQIRAAFPEVRVKEIYEDELQENARLKLT
jgi:putative NIF3 family GTP cyclohydrolase 1 type 2